MAGQSGDVSHANPTILVGDEDSAPVCTLWAFNEHSRQVLSAAQAAGASVLQCDRLLNAADSGYLSSKLRLLEEDSDLDDPLLTDA